jgi:hypothetical protein
MNATMEIYNIYFDKDLNAVIMEWQGYANSSQFREGTELMLNTLIKHNCSKVLADISDMTLIGMDDQEWLNNNFLPRAVEFGFKAIAILKPKSYFNQVAVESVSYKNNTEKLSIKFFDNKEDAKQWLKTYSI